MSFCYLIFSVSVFCTALISAKYTAARDVSQNEGLKNFYTALGGQNWLYRKDDVHWVFEEEVVHDPCAEHWAGIGCNRTVEGGVCDADLCVVTSIVLEEYNLTGSIPTSYSGITSLNILDIGYNSICGIIPNELGQLAYMHTLSLGINSLAGSFPPCMDQLSNLREIDIIGNDITGTLPDFLSSVRTIQNLYVGENRLTGPIPTTIVQMTNMEYLYITQNFINGSIPDALGVNLTRLYYLGLSTNCLTGIIPGTVGSLKELRYMMLNGNQLQGTIPHTIGSLKSLKFFEANYNELTGEIPSVFGSLSNMFAIEICSNHMNGTLPSSLGDLTGLDTLYLDANLFSGPIPSELGKLVKLTGLLLYDNLLTGTIPSAVGKMAALEELSLYKNKLTGLIPASVTSMTRLKELVLQQNQLFGFECLEEYENCEFDMPNLQRLDLSDNQFEGTVPMQIFHLPALRSVALVNGCFHGELNSDICMASNLEVLSLDGLTSSPHCRKNAYSPLGLQQGYIVRHYMGGSLPDCVWHMPNLTVLHVAGNGLSGTLPNDLRSDTKLLNVSIAYNRFSGTIPDILQNFPFIELCLAYNKLSGALSSTAHTTKNYGIYTGNSNVLPAGSIVSVEVNRLTGYTPLDFVKVGTLFALNGNFFDCDGQHPLPRNDEQSGYYICGSKNLDQSLAAWAVVSSLIFVFVGIVAIVQWNKRSLSHKETSSQMMSIEEEDDIASDADSMLTQELIPEHSYSLCTSPGSFDADDNLPENQLLHSRCSQNKPKRDLNYFTCSEQTKIFSASMWAYITSCVTLWILWFEISLREETDANKDLTPSKNGCISLSESACRLKDLKVFVSLLCMIRRSALLVTGIIILFCAPFYLLMKLVWGNQYSTHQYQYGWLVSSAFLSGIVPAVCLLLLFLILCCVLAYSLVMLYPSAVRDAMHHVRLSMLSYHRDSNHINLAYAGTTKNGSNCLSSFGSPDNSLSQNSIYTLLQGGSNTAFSQRPLLTKIGTKQFLAFSALFLLDVVITLSVNGLYVYGFDTSTHYYVKVFMKVVLALFQITWNLIVVPKTVEYVARVVHDKSSRVKWLMTLCLSFNYIIAPAMAGLLSSSTCFADYFKEQPSVVSFYEYDICRAYSLDVTTNLRSCNELTTAAFSTSFIPPFMYYYQCSSTLITSYVPILMLEHAIIVVVPICLVVALSHKHSANYVPDFFIRVIPSVVWPPQHRPAMTDLASYSGAIMRPDRMIAAFMSHFVVLITYGLANPFLAVAICIAMCTLTVLAQILIGRYICYYLEINNRQVQDFDNGDSAKAYRTPLDTLNSMCAGILDGLPSCLWTILLIGSLFMSAIFSDMASDQVSWQVGIVVGIPAFSAPFLAYGTLKLTLYSSYWSHNAQ